MKKAIFSLLLMAASVIGASAQYSEFKKWKETQISKDYKISWLPTMYLINPEGKVVYTTVLAERMAKKLAEIFPEK